LLQRDSQEARISPAIMLHIAGFLAGDMALGSLAALNIVNRETRTITLPVLYETLVLDKGIAGNELQDWTALNSGKKAHVK
jgi:hypothetical protein